MEEERKGLNYSCFPGSSGTVRYDPRMRKTDALVFAAAALVVCGAAVAQQMYRWVDKEGRTHYSEQPPPKDAKSVERRRSPIDAADSAAVADAAAAAKKNPVVLYTSPDCAQPCRDARELLAKRGIPHRVVDVNDTESFERLKKATGGVQVPTLSVGSKLTRGFEEQAWNQALNEAGYPHNVPSPVRIVRPPEPPKPAPQRPRYLSELPTEPSVRLFVTPDCGAPCDEARKLLAGRGVKVNEVAVSDPASFDELQRISGGVTVPVMVAGTKVVKGFEPNQYNAALEGIAKR
jgi:glutaredoxin